MALFYYLHKAHLINKDCERLTFVSDTGKSIGDQETVSDLTKLNLELTNNALNTIYGK